MAVVTQSIGSVIGRCAHSAIQPRIRLEIVPMEDDPVRLMYLCGYMMMLEEEERKLLEIIYEGMHGLKAI